MSTPQSLGRAAICISFYVLHGTAQYDSCTNGEVTEIGDGRCNAENNNPFCGFDGGDCCPCTCLDGPLHSCSDNGFECLYPDCDQGFASEVCFEELAGDSHCDAPNNNLACGYDGGDCCQCSCVGSRDYRCGVDGFACLDPICFDPATVGEFPGCAGDWLTIGDGSCDGINNNAACGFDGGDCCLCSCTGNACNTTVFDCVDPDANMEFFDCEAPPPTSSPCSTDAQQTWVVETSAEAQALAEAVNCTGGSFEVEWRGSVVVSAAMTVVDGTVLNISGADSTAVIDGNGTTRLFRVHNAVLYVSGVGISSGAGFSGGAIAALGSRLTFDRTNFTGNSAAGNGGAVYASHGSTLFCVREGIFANNTATLDGGGLYATGGSTISCGGSWLNNAAGDSGGAVRVQNGSSVSWSEETIFATNTAGRSGGAVSLEGSLSWSGGAMTFVGNSAVGFGGAVVGLRSDIVFDGATDFLRNTADVCGAIGAIGGSSVSWGGGTTRFISNAAYGSGGALFVMDSRVEWGGNTEFYDNVAEDGGAVYLTNGSYVAASGHTDFTSNTASADGGAVGSGVLDTLYNPTYSALIINGNTTFFNNTCGANGGALALLGALSVAINVPNVNLVQNSAGVAGGGIFMSNTGFGPVFTDVSFVSNFAQVGGALSMAGSGNSLDPVTAQPAATTFERCSFIGNRAAATGGAIETAAGNDDFVSSDFQDNAAGVGGALRLAGTASLRNCSFAENVSGDGEGAAVSNIGFISTLVNTSFSGNVFDCPNGMFLNFSESNDLFHAVCDGCPTDCNGCSFPGRTLAPMCSETIDHAYSAGGTVTQETLSIEPGYWRAIASSPNILPCFHAEACLGGVTGRANYCLEGYEGPYCAVCSDGYTTRLGMTCSKCSDSKGSIVLAAGVSAAALLVVACVVSYVVSGDGSDRTRGVVERAGQYIPLQSLKILIVAWQILTQFASVANISFPTVYQNFLDMLEVVNFDLSWILSGFCVVDVDFHGRLLIATIWPIVGLLFLAGVYTGAARVNRRSTRALQNVRHKHVSIVLLLTFLVYASVSALLFKTFACEELDDGKNYLRADYRIECDSPKHRAFQVYGGFMILLYTVGIPALYGGLLFRESDILRREQADREALARISSISELWRPYKPSVFYYEVVECARRILLTGVVVFIYPNTGAQIAATLLMAVVFAMLSEGLAPYASRWDTWLSRMGHAVVTMSMYVALLLKVDVSHERSSSQNVFGSLLVAAHACMVVMILMEIVVQGITLWVETREGSATPHSNSFLRRWKTAFGRGRRMQ